MSDSPDAQAVVATEAANDGFVAGTYFARWNPSQDVRALVHVILGGPVEGQVRDFFDPSHAASGERPRSVIRCLHA